MNPIKVVLTLLFMVPLVILKAENSETSKGTDEAEKTVKEGNLSFPVSQQPNPLISFGMNVLDNKETQVIFVGNQIKAHRQYTISMNPTLYYGLTDSLSLTIGAPTVIKNKFNDHRSAGIGDIYTGLEYAYYTKANKRSYDQATILATVTVPTGSVYKEPQTGIGANSYFFGTTISRMGVDWFYFLCMGGIFTDPHRKIKVGNQFICQSGVGRRITNNKNWLYAWILEFDGNYTAESTERHVLNRNSGGTLMIITPSIWISAREHFLFQMGIGIPVYQNFFGRQRKNHYLVTANVGWTF